MTTRWRGAVIACGLATASTAARAEPPADPATATFVPLQRDDPHGASYAVVSGDPRVGPVAVYLKLGAGKGAPLLTSSDIYAVVIDGRVRHTAGGHTTEAHVGAAWFQPAGTADAARDECLTTTCTLFVTSTGAIDDSSCSAVLGRALERATQAGMKEFDRLGPAQRTIAQDTTRAMMPKMKTAMAQVCVGDGWPPEALRCFDRAADAPALKACEDKLTATQQGNLRSVMAAALGMEKGAPPATPLTLPQECTDYVALVDRLQTSCPKMPKEARDGLKQAADSMIKGVGTLSSMPAEQRNQLAAGCKAADATLLQATAAVCGW